MVLLEVRNEENIIYFRITYRKSLTCKYNIILHKVHPEKWNYFLLGQICQRELKVRGWKLLLTNDVKQKLDDFLCRNDISFTLPGLESYVCKKVFTLDASETFQLSDGKRRWGPISSFLLNSLMSSSSKNILEGTKISQVNCLFPNCKNVEILCGRKVCENIDTHFKCHELVEKIII